jgi:acyl-CoA dehydrogenase
VGIAEAAREVAVREARRKGDVRDLELLVGEMETELALARGMHARMIDTAAVSTPGPDTTNTIAMARTLVGRAAIRTVEKAMEVVGGASFYRALSLERMFRDVQGARFHPLQEKPQFRYSGRFALGRDLDG